MDLNSVLQQAAHKQIFTNDINNVSNTGLFPPSIQKLPPEVWKHVFYYVDESVDVFNASNVVNLWFDIHHLTKQSWLFVQIFPLLLQYLSKKDVFVCRLVSQKWCKAVDHFLIQNSFHRPASSEPRTQLIETRTNQYKTDNRVNPIDSLLRKLDLRYNPVKMLKENATPHTLSPDSTVIVGRSALLAEENKNIRTPVNHMTNLQFLQKFGHQIQFLRITLDNISYFFGVIQYVPNLKKLDFIYLNTRLTQEQLNQQIANLSTTRPLAEIRALFPKSLETLRIYRMSDDQYVVPQLLLSLVGQQLESLTITAATPPPINQGLCRLLDLSIVIRENRQWDFFKCLVQCRIRRLLINVIGLHLNVFPLQVILRRFRETLRNLEIHFTEEVTELKFNPSHYQVFARDRLHLPNMIRLTFRNNFPPLNFICGNKSLQYIHVQVGKHAKGEARKIFSRVQRRMINGEEKLDLLKIIFDILAAAEEQIDWESASKYLRESIRILYYSNIWIMFPKLRVLTVLFNVRVNMDENRARRFNRYEKTKEYELRRDVFEKLYEQKINDKQNF